MISPQPRFLIRPIRPEEHYALGELTVAAYHSVGHREAYDRQLRDVARRAETSCVLVAVGPEGELLGGVTYVQGPDDPYSEELAEGEAGMRMLAVDPARQGQGIGRLLAQACLDRARAEGRTRLVLHTGLGCRARSDSTKRWASSANRRLTLRLPPGSTSSHIRST